MAEQKKNLNTCPICGSELKLPPFKCKSCNGYFFEHEVLSNNGGNARCPNCDSLVRRISNKGLKKDHGFEKCRKCGYSLNEIENQVEVTLYPEGKLRKLVEDKSREVSFEPPREETK